MVTEWDWRGWHNTPPRPPRCSGRSSSITLSMFDYGYLLDNVPIAVRGTRRPVDQIDLGTSWLTFVHLGLAVFGAVLACRSGWSILLAGARS